jgi:hypothetical protein
MHPEEHKYASLVGKSWTQRNSSKDVKEKKQFVDSGEKVTEKRKKIRHK